MYIDMCNSNKRIVFEINLQLICIDKIARIRNHILLTFSRIRQREPLGRVETLPC